MERRLRRGVSSGRAIAPLRDFALSAAAGLLVLAALGPAFLPALPSAAWAIAGALYLLGTLAAADFLRRTFPHPTLGLCNVVTLTRLVIVGALTAALVAGGGDPVAILALATAALALDGVDGWLARSRGRVSDFGARFDLEVDSAFALVLALHALASGTAGPMVLVLGAMRYAFVAAAQVLPWLGGPLPERFGRKAVCVIQMAALIVIQWPGLPEAMAEGLVLGAAGALVWSFGLDIRHLWRHRP
jgi:phosphatidylglycerophosphate synthase